MTKPTLACIALWRRFRPRSMPPETLSHRESHHSRHHIQSNHAPIVALACWHLNQPMKSCTNHCNTMQSNQSNTTNGSIQSCLDQIDTINNERERPSVISLYYLHIRDIAFSSRNRKSEKPYRDTEVILKTLRRASSCHLFCSLLVHHHTHALALSRTIATCLPPQIGRASCRERV